MTDPPRGTSCRNTPSAKPYRSTFVPRAASATPNTAAALTGLIRDFAENPPEDIDADVSTRISDRPGSAGRFASDSCNALSSAIPQRSDGACSYAARNRYGNCRDRATWAGLRRHSTILGAKLSSETS